MPQVGDMVRGSEIGKDPKRQYLWRECGCCGKGRWVVKYYPNDLCIACGKKKAIRTRYAPIRLVGYETAIGRDVGLKTDHLVYKDHCPTCGKGLWRTKSQIGGRCSACYKESMWGEGHPRWRGGRRRTKSGYIFVTLKPSHPFFCMAHYSQHTVQEHRLVMAEVLGRPLEVWEVVHHKNGVKDDNRPGNLMLLPSNAEHTAYIRMEQDMNKLEHTITGLAKRVTMLEAENVALIHDEEIRRLW